MLNFNCNEKFSTYKSRISCHNNTRTQKRSRENFFARQIAEVIPKICERNIDFD